MFQRFRTFLKNNPTAAERVFSYFQIMIGCVIGGAAYPLFMTPNQIAP